jgi:hypothetical protein
MLAAMRRTSCASRLPHLTAHDGTVIDSELRKRRTSTDGNEDGRTHGENASFLVESLF